MSMNLSDYLQTTRGVDLARELGVPAVLISQWSRGVRRVPAERCVQLEEATGGAVRCEDLRPDVNWAVLRGHCPEQQAA